MTETRTLHYRVKKTRVDSLLYAADQDLQDLFDIDGQKSDTMKQFRTIRSKMTDDGDCYRHTVKYTTTKERPKGRMYSAGKTFADLKPLSRFLLEGYVDCDQVKSNASILIGVGKTFVLGTQYLQQYRKGEYKIQKQEFAKLCNLDKLPATLMKYQDIHIEICRINKVLADGLEGHYEYKSEQKNHSPIAHKAQYVREILERAALECVYPIGINELIYRYDGVMVHDKHYNMMQFQESDLDYCREVIHSGIEVPDNPDSYLKLKEKFELNHFHMGQKVYEEDDRYDLQEMSWTGLHENNMPLECLNPDTGKIVQFTKIWQRDATHRKHTRRVFKPFSIKQPLIDADEREYNTFHGLEYQYQENNADGTWYEDHVRTVMEPVLADYWMNLTAFRYQKPRTRNISVPVIRGDEGTGKGRLFCVDQALLGDRYFLITESMENQYGKHNDCMANKLYCVSDEVSKTNANLYKEPIKAFVGNDQIQINPKCIKPYSIDNYANIAMISNNDIILDSERRTLYIYNGSDYKNDTEYWIEFTEKCKSKTIMQKLYNFFIEYDIEGFDPQTHPKTEEKMQKTIERYNPSQEWFVQQLETDPTLEKWGEDSRGNKYIPQSYIRDALYDKHIETFSSCSRGSEFKFFLQEKEIFQITNQRIEKEKVVKVLKVKKGGIEKAVKKYSSYKNLQQTDETITIVKEANAEDFKPKYDPDDLDRL